MTRVSMLRLTEAEIADYVESREGVGKAGGYAIQGRAEMLVKEISGSYSNVVGLPLALTVALLKGAGHGAECPALRQAGGGAVQALLLQALRRYRPGPAG